MHHVFQIWRNLMALKCAGHGHDPAGVRATSPGSLTVECPACPHPDRNLPENWEQAGPLMWVPSSLFAHLFSNEFTQVSLHTVHFCRRQFQT